MEFFILITFLSLLFLYFINNIFLINKNYLSVINLIFFTESIILIFFFKKFPSLLAFPIFGLSFYFLFKTTFSKIFDKSNQSSSIFTDKMISLFPYISFSLIISGLVYEFFADGILSYNFFLVFILSFILYIYKNYRSNYVKELDTMVVFFSLLVIFFVVSPTIYKISTNQVGQTITDSGWIEDSQVVHFLLAVPLSNMLQLFGFEVHAVDDYIYFEDTTTNLFTKVGIAEGCSGIYSVVLFLSALLSYLVVEIRNLDSSTLILLMIGVIVCYISNLFRMSIIIVTGHYYGMEYLLLVHKYAGWLIFTFLLFSFWIFLEKYFIVSKLGINNNR